MHMLNENTETLISEYKGPFLTGQGHFTLPYFTLSYGNYLIMECIFDRKLAKVIFDPQSEIHFVLRWSFKPI